MEGGEQMRRRKARAAKQRSEAPSAAAAISGASKQRHHLPRQQEHADRIETIRGGKHVSATWASTSSSARPGPPGSNRCRLRTAADPPGAGPRPGRGDPRGAPAVADRSEDFFGLVAALVRTELDDDYDAVRRAARERGA
jgi:hypothetical protein